MTLSTPQLDERQKSSTCLLPHIAVPQKPREASHSRPLRHNEELHLPALNPRTAAAEVLPVESPMSNKGKKYQRKHILEESVIVFDGAVMDWLERQEANQRRALVAQENVQWNGLAFLAAKIHKKVSAVKINVLQKQSSFSSATRELALSHEPPPKLLRLKTQLILKQQSSNRLKRIASQPHFSARNADPTDPYDAQTESVPFHPAPPSNALKKNVSLGRLKTNINGEEWQQRAKLMQDYGAWVIQMALQSRQFLRRSPSSKQIVRALSRPVFRKETSSV